MNDQKNREKQGNLLSVQDDDRGKLDAELRQANLDKAAYHELLSSWVAKGCQHWLPGRMDAGRAWRGSFKTRLQTDKAQWRDLMSKGQGRLSLQEKQNLKDRLSKAAGDPLLFFNLAGVPPLALLCQLEYWKCQTDALDRLRERMRSQEWRETDVKQLREASRIVTAYRPLLDLYAHIEAQTPVERPHCSLHALVLAPELKAVADLIEFAQKHRLVPPGANKGGPPKVEFGVLIRNLVASIFPMQELPEETIEALRELPEEKREHEVEKLAKHKVKPHWGAVTAVIKAAFPEWFKQGERNPIRNVKNAAKNPSKRATHAWWAVVVSGMPTRETGYAGVEWPDDDRPGRASGPGSRRSGRTPRRRKGA